MNAGVAVGADPEKCLLSYRGGCQYGPARGVVTPVALETEKRLGVVRHGNIYRAVGIVAVHAVRGDGGAVLDEEGAGLVGMT